MKLHLSTFLLLALLITATSVRAQQSSFTVAGIKPYAKAVPGQVMDLLIEGLGSGTTPTMLPDTDFNVEVSQDGITQTAKVRLVKFTMIPESNPETSSRNTVDIGGMKMRSYHAVSFVVPKGLHPGPAEVVASYKGRRGNSVSMEILERPLKPAVGTMAIMAVGGMPLDRTQQAQPQGNDLGWRLERGTTARVYVHPMVDPDDPNSAVLIRFKQGGNDYEAVTRIKSTPAKVVNRGPGVGLFAAREELEVDVPAALVLGTAQVEIRLKANGQVSDPTTITATITDATRAAEAPNVSAPRVLAATPSRVGAGQSLLISIDRRGTLEPSPKETQVIIEQDSARYFATIEQNSALITGKASDTPVAMFVRTTRQLIGRVQVRVLNPLRGEQSGLSEPVTLEILDEVIPPELISVSESTDAELAALKQIYETQKQAGKEFSPYDPNSRYLTVRTRGIDYNPRFVRITLRQADHDFTLMPSDFSSYSNEGLIIRLPRSLTGKFDFTIENYNGERYSTPATKSFVLRSQ